MRWKSVITVGIIDNLIYRVWITLKYTEMVIIKSCASVLQIWLEYGGWIQLIVPLNIKHIG